MLLEAKKLAGSLGETWRRDIGKPENLSPEAGRVMEDGHSSPSKRKGGRGTGPRFRPGARTGAGYIEPPPLPCSSLALLLASLAPSSSQASSLSKSLESRVLQCCEVRRSLGGGWWETARRRLIGF